MMRTNKKGAVLVEFVIILPLFLFLLFGMIYGSMWLHDYNGLNELTRAAARYGAVDTSGNTYTNKKNKVMEYLKENANTYLTIYRVDISNGINVSTDATGGALIGVGGDGEKDTAIVVGLTAKRGEVPILIEQLLPKTIESEFKMKLEMKHEGNN